MTSLFLRRLLAVRHLLTLRSIHLTLWVFLLALCGSSARADVNAPQVSVESAESKSLDLGAVAIEWLQDTPEETRHSVERVAVRAFDGRADQRSITAGIERLLARLADAGFRRAHISPTHFAVDRSRLTFTLTIEPGPITIVSDYRFADMQRTDTTWLSSVISLPTQVPLTSDWLSRARARISSLSNLRMVSPPEIESGSIGDGERIEVVVVFHPTEIAPSRFDGLVAASNDGDVSSLTGRVALEFAGLFQRDRTASLLYNRQRPDQSALTLRLAERGAFGQPLGWALELDEMSTVHRRQSVRGTVDYAFSSSRRWHAGVSGMWRKVTSGQAYVAPARITELSLSLGRSSGSPSGYGDPLRRATSLSVAVAYSHRNDLLQTQSDAPEDRLRVLTDALIQVPVASSWAIGLSTEAQGWSVSSSQLGAGDEWYLGGADRLRGYEEQTFAATSGVWFNLDISHALAPQLSTSVFGETAWLRLADQASGEPQPVCYGWALGLASPQRHGRLEIAWRRGAPLRDGFLRLKISQSW